MRSSNDHQQSRKQQEPGKENDRTNIMSSSSSSSTFASRRFGTGSSDGDSNCYPTSAISPIAPRRVEDRAHHVVVSNDSVMMPSAVAERWTIPSTVPEQPSSSRKSKGRVEINGRASFLKSDVEESNFQNLTQDRGIHGRNRSDEKDIKSQVSLRGSKEASKTKQWLPGTDPQDKGKDKSSGKSDMKENNLVFLQRGDMPPHRNAHSSLDQNLKQLHAYGASPNATVGEPSSLVGLEKDVVQKSLGRYNRAHGAVSPDANENSFSTAGSIFDSSDSTGWNFTSDAPRTFNPSAVIRARRDRKATEGLTTGGPLPGAYEVYCLSFNDDTETMDPSSAMSRGDSGGRDSIVIMDIQANQSNSKRRGCILIGFLLVVMVSLGTGVAIAFRKGSSVFEEKRNQCDFTDQEQPSVLLQCECTGKISVRSNMTMSRYTALIDILATSTYTNYDEDIIDVLVTSTYTNYDEEMDSCSNRNVALMHVASESSFEVDAQLVQRFLLVFLYLSWSATTSWERDEGWLSSDPECTWYGVSCKDGDVTGLELAANGLSGSLVSEVFSLQSLESLNIGGSTITGTISEAIVRLSNLTELVIGLGIKGTIPSAVGSLFNLRRIALSGLGGTIPPSFEQLTNLEVLHLNAGSMSGSIPDFFGDLLTLKSLTLRTNQITGTIPTSVGNLTNLEVLMFDKNQITGPIPSELGRCTKLAVLDMSVNELSGTIPSYLATMSDIQELSLNDIPEIYGTIPEAFKNLRHLTSVDVGMTRIDGVPDGICGNSLTIFTCPLYSSIMGTSLECSCCKTSCQR